MRGGSGEADLEHVLDELVEADGVPGPATLDRWIREYPQFESELVDFMASWTLMNSAAVLATNQDEESDEAARAADERLMLRGMSIVQNLLHHASRRPAIPPLNSLLGAAKEAGLSLREFGRATHLGDALIRKLDRRLIRFSSIPKQAIDALAEAARVPAQAVATYLQLPATFAAAPQYRADRAPQLAEQEEFRAAVQKDPTMTPEDRSRWLDAPGSDRS
jgi:hypothetical protein